MKLIQKIFFVGLIFLIGCSPRVVRIGYDNSGNSSEGNCEVVIKKLSDFDEDEVEVKGEIKIKDTGFSIKCEEADVLRILKQEACAVGADIINIIEERRADIFSTCYRVEAELLKSKGNNETLEMKSDKQYSEEQIDERVKNDKGRKQAMIIIPIISGIMSLVLTLVIVGSNQI